MLVACIAVGGGGDDVGETLLVESNHERAMHVEGAEAAARLGQAAPLGHCLAHDPAELLMPRQVFVQIDRTVEIDVCARGPAREVGRAHLPEHIIGDACLGQWRTGDLRRCGCVHDAFHY